jgi:hypothetical protein
MFAVSVISTMKVERPPVKSSPAPTRVKAGLVTKFEPGLVEVLREFKPTRELFVYMQNASGAVGDLKPTDTAFWNRKSMANLMIFGTWKDPAKSESIIATIRAAWEKVAPFTSGFYTNLSDADQKSTNRNFGDNFARLAKIKKQYDPGNLLRLNSNIAPAG